MYFIAYITGRKTANYSYTISLREFLHCTYFFLLHLAQLLQFTWYHIRAINVVEMVSKCVQTNRLWQPAAIFGIAILTLNTVLQSLCLLSFCLSIYTSIDIDVWLAIHLSLLFLSNFLVYSYLHLRVYIDFHIWILLIYIYIYIYICLDLYLHLYF